MKVTLDTCMPSIFDKQKLSPSDNLKTNLVK